MGWLGGLSLASIVVAWVVSNLAKDIFGSANSAVSNAAHGTLFGVTVGAITAKGGVDKVTKSVRGLSLNKFWNGDQK